VTANDRGSQLASPAFDASVWEIWPYLSAGASVAICPDGVKSEPAAFRDWLLAERVTVSFAPTDLAERLFTLDWPAAVSLRYLLTGGARLMTRPGKTLPFHVANNYGPTENSVVTTSGIVDPDETGPPSIGRAIANHSVYVLDEALRLAPLGVPGELCVGGPGLAHGYVNDDEKTERSFVHLSNGERVYCTGDLVRMSPDGALQFLGRIDGQLNVLGHRIEPTEIEAAACAHPGVTDAAVLPLNDGDRATGLRLLVAGNGAETGDTSDCHVDRWRTLYDDTYSDHADTPDPSLNTIGWNSSYTGAPISASEMREWRDETVKRLRALQPKRVLEIGCGTGMLLAQLAPECHRYTGVDFSQHALEYVRSRIVEPRDWRHVTLHLAAAHELDAIHDGPFDLVILNSIVQYFPSGEYLRRVLESAIARTADSGTVFVGDVRDRSLLEAFHTDVHLANEPGHLSVSAITKRVQSEEELLIDPLFFHDLSCEHDAICTTHTFIKRGEAENELTKYRYDALIHVGSGEAATQAETLAWGTDVATEATARERT
jgi:acyl-CoA synthetase (AMP-forming)/AMP-acid ligase II